MFIDPAKTIQPSFLLALLVLAATGCTEPGATEDDPSTSATGETESVDTSSGGSESADSASSDSGIDPSCGNGIVDPNEACDDQAESSTCDADCTAVECGDMTLNAAAGEECDGINLAGATCQTLDLGGGTLSCGQACSYDTSGCGIPPAAPVLSLGFSVVKQFDFSWAAVADAEYYRLEESAAPGEPFVPLGGDIVGESISLTMPLHFRYEASYRLRACNAVGCTDSAVVEVMSSLVEAVGYLKASNTGVQDQFGYSIALSGDGNTLAVGASEEGSNAAGIDGDQANDSASRSGAVYVFVRDGAGEWSQQAYVKASNAGTDDYFGYAVTLSDDGNTLAVGAHNEDSSATGINGDQANDATLRSGAAYVFVRDAAGGWSQQAYIKASNTDADDYFGEAVALSEDGNTLAVGAASEDSNATVIDGDQANDLASNAGAVYVFVRDGAGGWSQQAYVKASNTDAGDRFGVAVALSTDGNTLAVGAALEDGGATGIDGDQADDSAFNAGAVYVFVRDGMGAWSQQAYVKASDVDTFDRFGIDVALSEDGDTLAVGASFESSNTTGLDGDQANNSAFHAGAAYVFVRDLTGAWTQQVYVKASNTDEEDEFGGAVMLSADGNTLAVGAALEDSNATGIDGEQAGDSSYWVGAVYVLVRDDMGAWSQRAYVKASNAGSMNRFGSDVALSDDGNTLAVGAYDEDSNATGIDGDQANDAAPGSGAVYLY